MKTLLSECTIFTNRCNFCTLFKLCRHRVNKWYYEIKLIYSSSVISSIKFTSSYTPNISGCPLLKESCLNMSGILPLLSFTRRNPYKLSCRIKLEIFFVLKSCLSLATRILAVNFVGFSMTIFSPSWLHSIDGIFSSLTNVQSLYRKELTFSKGFLASRLVFCFGKR